MCTFTLLVAIARAIVAGIACVAGVTGITRSIAVTIAIVLNTFNRVAITFYVCIAFWTATFTGVATVLTEVTFPGSYCSIRTATAAVIVTRVSFIAATSISVAISVSIMCRCRL